MLSERMDLSEIIYFVTSTKQTRFLNREPMSVLFSIRLTAAHEGLKQQVFRF